MAARLRLLSFWVLLLLVAALCPAAYGKRGASFKGRGKSDGVKASPSQGRGLSKQGLKWAGAAAAGMLGGTGLGFLGKPKHGTGNHYKPVASEQQQPYHQENLRHHNQSVWKAFVRGAAPANRNIFPALGHVVPFLTWMINK